MLLLHPARNVDKDSVTCSMSMVVLHCCLFPTRRVTPIPHPFALKIMNISSLSRRISLVCTVVMCAPADASPSHTRSTRQTGHWSRQPECTRSRQVQCQDKSMFRHGTRRLSAVQMTEAVVPSSPPRSRIQPLAATLSQRPAGKQSKTDQLPQAWVMRESQDSAQPTHCSRRV